MKATEVIEQMNNDITWYQNNMHSQSIDDLSKVADHIATNNYWLAENVANAFSIMTTAENNYKTLVSDYQDGSEDAVSRSKVAAETKYKQERLDWKEAQGIHKFMSLKHEAATAVVDQMRQRISYLKDEKRQTRMQNQT